jgi:hypothetical protein
MGKLIFLVGIIGFVLSSYLLNIYKFAKCDFKSPYRTEVIRGVGIFPIPFISLVTGYMDIGEENK